MNVSLTNDLLKRMPNLTVHVLIARAIHLDVLQYFQVVPPALDTDTVETLLVQWQTQLQAFPGTQQAPGAMAQLVRSVMNQRFESALPMLDMARYAALLALCPVTCHDLNALNDQLVLDLAQAGESFVESELAGSVALPRGEPVWRDGQGRIACRGLNARQAASHQLTEHTADIVFISEHPEAGFPVPGRAMHYLQATLTPLCDRLQLGVLNAEQTQLAF